MSTAAAIKKHNPKKSLLYKKGKTKDIIKVTLDVEQTDHDDTVDFAKNFSKSKAGLAQLYRWVKHNITYKEDPPGVQWIQTPSHLNFTKVGDCKSFTVFICSVLHNMGIDYIIRFSAYTKRNKRVTHVYPVAVLSGEKIPLDVVYSIVNRGPKYLPDGIDKFGQEKPFSHKIDFYKSSNMTAIYKLGNIPNESQKMEQISKLMSDVPDSIVNEGIGDVTRLTQGELDRFIMSDRMKTLANHSTDSNAAGEYRNAAQAIAAGSISGIGSMSPGVSRDVELFLRQAAMKKKPAFKMPTEMARHAIGGIGKILKKIFKKFINWIVKGPLKFMSPYFLFLFLKKKTTAKIEARRKKQMKTFAWIQRSTGMTQSSLLGLTYNGILKQTGKAPAQILNSGGHKIAGAPLAALIPKILKFVKLAVGFIIKVVKKIVSLFKKKARDAGEIGEGAMSDITLLEELPDGNQSPGTSTNQSPNPGGGGPRNGPFGGGRPRNNNQGGGSGGSNTGLLAAGAAAVALYALS